MLLVFSLILSSCGRRGGNTRRHARTERRTETRRSDPRAEIAKVPPENERTNRELDGPGVYKKCSNAVFMIFTSDGENGFQGSGFFISPDGLAVSNYHIFQGTYQGMEQIKLQGSDVAYKIKNVIAKSEEEDYILFRVDCNVKVPYIPIAKSKPNIGEKVFAIGSPRGLENTFSSGEVSQWRGENLMQISALIDHGSSGGALLNVYGEVIGITSGTFYDGSQANLNYAWSINVIKKHLDKGSF